MNKWSRILIIVFLFLLVPVICFFIYVNFTKDENEDKNLEGNTKNAESVFTLENYPRVDVSTGMQELSNAYIRKLTGKDVNSNQIQYTNSETAYNKLIDGNVDLIIVPNPDENQLKMARDKGIELEITPLIEDGFIFYVNNENPVNDLTLEQIQKIYSGEITNWSKVGGNNSEIVALQRNANSENQNGMISLVMEGKQIKTPTVEEKVWEKRIISNIVSDFDNGLDSIGYSYFSYAHTMYDSTYQNVLDGIKILNIDGIQPSFENIQSGAYKLKMQYYVIIKKDSQESSNAKKLKDIMISEEGKNIAKEAGYVPTR